MATSSAYPALRAFRPALLALQHSEFSTDWFDWPLTEQFIDFARHPLHNENCFNPTTVPAAHQAIADAGQDGGFILGSGCEVPVAALPENFHAMIHAARAERGPAARNR